MTTFKIVFALDGATFFKNQTLNWQFLLAVPLAFETEFGGGPRRQWDYCLSCGVSSLQVLTPIHIIFSGASARLTGTSARSDIGNVSFSPPYSEGLSGPRRRDLFRLDRETLARSRCKGGTVSRKRRARA